MVKQFNDKYPDYTRPDIWDSLLEFGEGGYQPYNWQIEHIHSRNEKRVIAACGRRAGKSTAIVAEAWRELMRPKTVVAGVEHRPLVYIIAPNYELTMRVWEPFVKSCIGDPTSGKAPLLAGSSPFADSFLSAHSFL